VNGTPLNAPIEKGYVTMTANGNLATASNWSFQWMCSGESG